MATVLEFNAALLPRGPFDLSASYETLNFVESGGSGYVCLQPCTGIPVTNAAYWFKFVHKGDPGTPFTYADLTAEQKAELAHDATIAAQAAQAAAEQAAQKFTAIKDAIDALDPSQSTSDAIVAEAAARAAKDAELESTLGQLGPKIDEVDIEINGSAKNYTNGRIYNYNTTPKGSVAIFADGATESEYIPVQNGDVIDWYSGSNDSDTNYNRIGLAYYNSEKTLLGCYSCNYLASRTITLNNANVAYVRASFLLANISDCYVKVNNTLKWRPLEDSVGHEQRITANETNINLLDGRTTAVEQGLNEINSGKAIDISELEVHDGYIDVNNSNKWTDTDSATRQHVVVPVNTGDILRITANADNASNVCLLSSYNISEGVAATVVERKVISAGGSWEKEIAANVKFVFIQTKSGSSIYTPSYVSTTGSIEERIEKIESLEPTLAKVNDITALRTDVFGGDVNGTNIQFEIGHVAIGDSSWSFSTDLRRVRIARDNPLVLRKGDVLTLTDYNTYRMYVGWRVESNYGKHNAWLTEDFTCPVDGEYEVLISRISDETNLSSVTELSQYFVLKKNGIAGGSDNTMSRSRSLRSICHQGYTTTSSSYGNNLADGYVKAAKMGFDFGECDFQFSSDGVPFCCHPTKINDVWENAFRDPVAQEYVYFAQNTAAQIKAHAYIDADHTVSTFEEVIAACKSVGLGIYLDKTDNILTEDNWTSVFNILKQYVMMDKAVWAVNTEAMANKILTYYPCAKITIYNNVSAANIALANRLKTPYNEISLDVNADYISAAAIKTAYESLSPGIRIIAFTIDTEAKYRQYMPYVDGIISNTIAEPMLV